MADGMMWISKFTDALLGEDEPSSTSSSTAGDHESRKEGMESSRRRAQSDEDSGLTSTASSSNDLDELAEGLSNIWGKARSLGTKLLDNMNEHVLGGSFGDLLAPGENQPESAVAEKKEERKIDPLPDAKDEAQEPEPPEPPEPVVRKIPIVGVMGSSQEEHAALAQPLGRLIARLGMHLLTGGGTGVMTAVSRAFVAVRERRGWCMGVLPGLTEAGAMVCDEANPYVEIPIRTHLPPLPSMDPGSRNHVNVLTSDVVLALPGSIGTESEIEMALLYRKPVAIFCIGDVPRNFKRFEKANIPVLSSLGAVEAFIKESLTQQLQQTEYPVRQADSPTALIAQAMAETQDEQPETSLGDFEIIEVRGPGKARHS